MTGVQTCALPISPIDIEKFVINSAAWNEHWLISAINNSHKLLHDKYVLKHLNKDEEKVYLLIKELILNRRNLVSLWKKNHSYNDFVSILLNKLLKNKKIISTLNNFIKSKKYLKLKSSKGISALSLENKIKMFNDYWTLLNYFASNKKIDDFIIAKYKYRIIKLMLEISSILNKDLDEFLEIKLISPFKSILDQKHVEVFVKVFAKRLKAGVDRSFELSSSSDHNTGKTNIEYLGRVSSVVEELELTSFYSPQLYVYITYNDKDSLKFSRPLDIDDKKMALLLQKLTLVFYNKFINSIK